jgi:opacity protein-like surface antigen
MKKFNNRILFFLLPSFIISTSICPAIQANAANSFAGPYVGAKVGLAFSHFKMISSTEAGALLGQQDASIFNIKGQQRIQDKGFLAGITGGYNWQYKQFLIGLEADLQSLSTNGETQTNAIPYVNSNNQFYAITSRGSNNWLFTARPRLGFLKNDWLFYLTGGLGLAQVQADFIFFDNRAGHESQRVSKLKPGYVLGAGIETELSNQLSIKLEYLYDQFSRMNAYARNNFIPVAQSFSKWANLNASLISFGMNYHFNNENSKGTITKHFFNLHHWQSDVGARLFVGSGVNGGPQPLLFYSSIGNRLSSRLIFNALTGVAEEIFARFDHENGVFIKGNIGAGSVTNGFLNHEDFPEPGGIVYSHYISDIRGNLSYANVDLGYSFIKNLNGKLGVFVGYNYYAQNLNVYGCQQLAGASLCKSAIPLQNFLGITEENHYDAIRLGLSTIFNLTQKLSINADAALLPWVNYKGLNIHTALGFSAIENADKGNGSMLETVLNYQFHPSWQLGLGGRYWMWNMRDTINTFKFLNNSELIKEPIRFNAKRQGLFLQVNYHPEAMLELDKTAKLPSWKGLFVGGHLGGMWGKNYWSDPFGSTEIMPNAVNIAGFGDKIRQTGPLAGVDINMNWQTKQFVYGVSASISDADIRGENTVFSGLGGINAKSKIKSIATIAGRVGTTLNSALLYINAGASRVNTDYQLNGNTLALSLVTDSETVSNWGFLGGLGVEYALNEHCTATLEYDYTRLPHENIAFNKIEVIRDYPITVNQNLNLFKLGLNYKFDIFKTSNLI